MSPSQGKGPAGLFPFIWALFFYMTLSSDMALSLDTGWTRIPAISPSSSSETSCAPPRAGRARPPWRAAGAFSGQNRFDIWRNTWCVRNRDRKSRIFAYAALIPAPSEPHRLRFPRSRFSATKIVPCFDAFWYKHSRFFVPYFWVSSSAFAINALIRIFNI